jgi:ParB family transcriptional regulator, chromosome partitioning protein
MQLLDIDTISRGRYTSDFSGLTPLEEKQARLSGISEALTIRTMELGQYEIVGNPKSWFLAQAIQEAQVPVIIVDHLKIDELEILKTPITEKLPIIEWAERISDLTIETPNLAELGRREGLSRSTVCNLVRIDAMPFEIKEQIRKHPKLIKLGHAKVLAGLDGRKQQLLLTQIIQKGLSVHETEKRAKNEKPTLTIEKDPDTIKVENRLTEILGCTTTINLEQGTLIIKYGQNIEVLQGVLEHLGYEEF